jgi:UDP:flavonoid glycosyltransferase YjiC (YdhE family)
MVNYLGIPISELLFRLGRPWVFMYHLAPLNKLRREHGLARLDSLGAAYTHGDHTLLCDVPGLVPTYELPANHHYIGPLVWSPQTPLPPWWQQLDTSRPTVYLTPGSTGRADLLPEMIVALSALPINLLVATAGRTEIGSLPDNVYAADYLPGEAAAARSALVICNGGSATVYQALAQGTPVLGIASNMDQFLSMGYVERRGAGRLLRAGRAHGQLVARIALAMIYEDQYKQAAGSIAEEFKRYPAEELFPQLLNRLL